jgi:DnaJ-class molecular chaperone
MSHRRAKVDPVRFDPFTVLDVPATATFDEAKAAYRRLAEIFHPDRFADSRDDVRAEAEKQMKRLNQAWAVVRVRLGDTVASAQAEGRSWESEQRRTMWDEDFGERARHARTREQARRRRSQAEQEAR